MTVEVIKQNTFWQGKRMTRQRRMIYENLAGRLDHPDVETIYSDTKPFIPKLSLQTVYRTIGLFEDMAMVRRVAVCNGHIRYDADMRTHSHFMCEECESVVDVDFPEMPWLGSACRAGRLGAVKSCEVLLKGVCHACLEITSMENLNDLAACG